MTLMEPCIICGKKTSYTFDGATPEEHIGKPMCAQCQAKVHGTAFTGCKQEKCGIKLDLPPRDGA